MSKNLMALVKQGYIPEGTGASYAKLILLTLAEHADDDGRNAYPSVETLSFYTSMSERSVQRALRKLEEDGVLIKDVSSRATNIPAKYRPNQYQVITQNLRPVEVTEAREIMRKQREEEPDQARQSGSDQLPESHPTLPGHPASNNPSSVVPPISSSDEEDEEGAPIDGRDDEEENLNTFTDGSSAENEKLTGSDTQTPSPPVTASPPAVTESISVAAPAGRQQTTNPPVEESSPRDTRGSQNGIQSLEGIRNPDKTAGWEPSAPYMDEARRAAPDVRPDLLVSEYVHWCYIKGIQKSDDHWIKWAYRKQRELDEKKMLYMLEKDREQREEKPWYERDLRF